MRNTTRRCARAMREAELALRGAQLDVDEVTSLLAVERQLQTAIMVAGAKARAALIAEQEAAKAKERGFTKHLKSVPVGVPE